MKVFFEESKDRQAALYFFHPDEVAWGSYPGQFIVKVESLPSPLQWNPACIEPQP